MTHLHRLCGWSSLLEYTGLNSGGREGGGEGGRGREREGGREEGRKKGREGCGPLNNKSITEERSCLL